MSRTTTSRRVNWSAALLFYASLKRQNGVGMQTCRSMSAKFERTKKGLVRFIQLGNLLLELEVLEDLTGLDEKALDGVRQILRRLVRITFELLEIQLVCSVMTRFYAAM
jgi:hypothetical protein